ncbi:efflux RND transporter permease subunit [uncultured Bacteroides sp.]|uniref:efflux RND transporter permease subunit n=1 Tax=uncultured Bacteroides sp. TaxID=162156 RepID=UPI002AA6627B|nr:efflux RND transporter permease subunit [uncultured Bacteroides sp.]
MKLDKFINRPVLSTVISILIVILGILGLTSLPITQYPDIAPPTIQVSTTYSGADAQTVLNSVIAPLEESINGVENMTYMTSSATNNGSATITVYFKQGTNPDMAAVNVQNRVSAATNLLPAEVVQVGVTTAKRQSSMLVIFSVHATNNQYTEAFLQNYANINILPQIKRIPGVGSADAFGAKTYSMRIWLKPDVMRLYKLIPSDVTAALAEQNIEAAPGQFGENGDQSFQYVMRYKGRLKEVAEFENIIIKASPDGQMLRLKDVARVELGGLSYAVSTSSNGQPGVICAVYQTAGSNATAIIKDVQNTLKEAQKNFPPGVTYDEMMNTNDFLFASISEVVKTLIEAFILVFIVVYIFLQDFRSTLVPAIAVPVSLIGTFFFLYIFGFSINLLTLFALVLAIAIVVDDAIVVVEAVHAKLDQGYKSARLASIDAMSEISGAIVSITLVMAAVFIPVTFMGGTSGVFYTQFGVTLAIAIFISALNALTLSPALCAILLKPHADEHGKKPSFIDRFHNSFNAAYNVTLEKYKKGVQFFIYRKWVSLGAFVLFAALLAFLMMKTPTGLVPNEDTGTFFITVSLPPATSLEKTEATMNEVDKLLEANPLIRFRGQVKGYSFLAGQGSPYGTFVCRLKNWDERTGKGQDANSVIGMLYAQTQSIKNAQILIFAPPMISGFSATNGFEFSLEDKTGGDVNKFFGVAQSFLGKLNQRPEIAAAQTSFDPRFPQYMIDVDVAKCKKAGISPNDVMATLQGYYGGLYASNFNRFGKLYRVMIQADAQYRVNPETMNNIYLRNGTEMAPVSEFITMKKVYGPQNISRFNMFTSIGVNGSAANGYSSGDAIKAIQEVAAETLPAGYGYEFAGLTRSEQSSSNATVIVFALCIMFVYFILSAQYESYILPLTVILSLPFGLAGSFIFAHIMGVDNNVYLQIALIMLIGLLAKNAILITEFALERRRTGMAITWSAILAAAARLRPILMTSLAMIIGLLPLMFASGVGANGNSSLGTGAVGGMLIGMICQIFIVPVLFVIFESIQEKFKPMHFEEADPNVLVSELEQYTNLHKDKKK